MPKDQSWIADLLNGAISSLRGISIKDVVPSEAEALVVSQGSYVPAGVHRMVVPQGQGRRLCDSTGTIDATDALMSMLDSNSASPDFDAYLPATTDPLFSTGYGLPLTMYAIRHPLPMDDGGYPGGGNYTKVLRGAGRERVGIMPTMLTPGNAGTQSWIGPLIICGNCNLPGATYVTDATGVYGSTTCFLSGTPNKEYINLSQWDTGTLNGATGLCFELEGAQINDSPGGYNYHWASSAGTLLNLGETANSFELSRTDNYGGPQWRAAIVVGGVQYIVSVPDWTANTKQVITFDWDGSHARLFLDGQQPNYSVVVSGPGGAPAVTFSGTPVVAAPFDVEIDGAGTFKWRFNGGAYTTGVAMGTLPSVVPLSGGVSVDFPVGTYTIGQHWMALPCFPTAATSGSFVQKWYEEFIVGGGILTSFPEGPQAFTCGATHKARIGRHRLSNISRYTAPFTPNPSGWTCDANTKALIDFSPANQGATVRASFGDWIVGRTGALSPSGAGRTNLPVWYNLHVSTFPYHDNCRIEDLYLLNPQGSCIRYVAALKNKTARLIMQAYHPIAWHNFSYNNHIDHCHLPNGGDNGAGFGHKFGLWFADGAQANYVGPGMANTGKLTVYIMVTGSDLSVQGGVPTDVTQTYIYMGGGSLSCDLRDLCLDDENGIIGYAHITLSACQSFRYFGGFGGGASTGMHAFLKVGHCQSIELDTWAQSQGSVPLISFGPDGNQGYPVRWNGITVGGGGYSPTVIDPSNPGPVVVVAQEAFGNKVINFTADPASNLYVIPQQPADAFWRKYRITQSGGGLTATTTLEWPANPGKYYSVNNLTTQTLHLRRHGSSSPFSLAASTSVEVYDNGTDLVAA